MEDRPGVEGVTEKAEWYHSPREDDWSDGDGPFDTRGDAIADGEMTYEESDWSSLFWVGKKKDFAPKFPKYLVHNVIGWNQDHAYEFAGDHVGSWLDSVPDDQMELLKNGLEKAFLDWLAATGNMPTFFGIDDISEHERRPPEEEEE